MYFSSFVFRAIVIEPLESRIMLSHAAPLAASLQLAHSTGHLLQPHSFYQRVVSVGNQAVFVGEPPNTPPPGYQNLIEVYDAATGTWFSPGVTHELFAIRSVGGKVVFINGRTTGLYDPATRQVSEGAQPELFGNGALAVLGSKLFIGGGQRVPADPNEPLAETATVHVYDAATGKWSQTQRGLSAAREDITAAVAGTKVIFLGGGGLVISNVGKVVDVYDTATGKWTASKTNGVPELALTVGDVAVFAESYPGRNGRYLAAQLYDGVSGHWSVTPFPDDTIIGGLAAVAVGTRAVFAGETASGGEEVETYDTVTGQWSTTALPAGYAFQPSITAVGTKVIVGGIIASVAAYGKLVGADYVDVYDVATGQTATAPLSLARGGMGATTVGAQAIFAGGGDVNTGDLTDLVDFYTDPSPAAALGGAITGKPSGRAVTVTLFNTGDASLSAGSTVGVYASPTRSLDGHPLLLGQANLAQPLQAGSSGTVIVSAPIPKTLAPGKYHLVAAVDDGAGSGPTPIASQEQTFTVRAQGKKATAHPFAFGVTIHGWPARV